VFYFGKFSALFRCLHRNVNRASSEFLKGTPYVFVAVRICRPCRRHKTMFNRKTVPKLSFFGHPTSNETNATDDFTLTRTSMHQESSVLAVWHTRSSGSMQAFLLIVWYSLVFLKISNCCDFIMELIRGCCLIIVFICLGARLTCVNFTSTWS